MSSTKRGASRAVLDAYFTPDNLAQTLVGTLNLAPRTVAWEPHAGGGSFVRALRDVGAEVFASDVNPDAPGLSVCGVGFCADFTKIDRLPDDCRPGWIIGNPPYEQAVSHVRRALSWSGIGVAFLLRLAFLEGKGRIPFWREPPAARVYVLSERPSFTGGKTDSCAYGWFIWDRRHIGATELCVLSWR